MRGIRLSFAIVLIAGMSMPVLAQRRRDNPPPSRQERREDRRDFRPQFQQDRQQQQKQDRQPQQQQQQDRQQQRQNDDNRAEERGRRPGPHIGDWLRRHEDLSPADQQKQLETDPGYQKSSPE